MAERVADFDEIVRKALARADASLKAVSGEEAVGELLESCRTQIHTALNGDGWKTVYPGRRVLDELARCLDLKNPVALQNSLIKGMAADRRFIPNELVGVIETIAAGERFTPSEG